ncbi:hypothetical protein [Actinacidiphila sp. ITFR-21]|uniref:hypothetical protein n=1 Tax=Actinacidiphila sp. ITFR-21 TaxID=3075199 RepID=UPI0028897CDC|nr:hypothetical protein [Streptomyces sp. ITFR-21]WNI18916.1 hypothetical protein RLT57_27565 [Streptomyces sp. ITFR-21]
MADQDAYDAVIAQVRSSPTATVDELDAALLGAAAGSISAEARLRLVRFYAMFKIAEVLRYEEFRGFPQ